MTTSEARRQLFAFLSPTQLRVVDELVGAYEQEEVENAITSSEPETARQRVLAARALRGLLKPPKGDSGQA